MDSQSLKDLTRRWIFGFFDEGNLDVMKEMASEEFVHHLNSLEPLDAEALHSVHSNFLTAFPDLNNTIEEQVAEGKVVVTRGITRGTHEGPLGELPATGIKVAVPWMIFTRFEGGRIVEGWQLYDEHAFMKQLGIVPESV